MINGSRRRTIKRDARDYGAAAGRAGLTRGPGNLLIDFLAQQLGAHVYVRTYAVHGRALIIFRMP